MHYYSYYAVIIIIIINGIYKVQTLPRQQMRAVLILISNGFISVSNSLVFVLLLRLRSC